MRRTILVLPLLLGGCAVPSWVPFIGAPAGIELFPGGKDSIWAYDIDSESGSGYKGLGHVNVENVATMGDTTVKAYSSAPWGPSSDSNPLKITKESVQFGGSKDALKLKLPLKENIELDTFKSGGTEYVPKIKSREDVTVAGGTKLNCWKIVFETKADKKEVYTWWIREGVGFVQIQTRDSSDRKSTVTLNSYTLR